MISHQNLVAEGVALDGAQDAGDKHTARIALSGD